MIQEGSFPFLIQRLHDPNVIVMIASVICINAYIAIATSPLFFPQVV